MFPHINNIVTFLHLLNTASADKEEGANLASKWENTTPVYVNVETHTDQLEKLIKEHDLVIR